MFRCGVDADLCQKWLAVEVDARKRLSREIGRDAARDAQLIVTSAGRFALSVDARHIATGSGGPDLALFFGADTHST